MARALPARRIPRHHLTVHRKPPRRDRPAGRLGAAPVRLSNLVLALLGVTLLGGFTLMAAAALVARVATP